MADNDEGRVLPASVRYLVSMLQPLCTYCIEYQVDTGEEIIFDSSQCQCALIRAEPMYNFDDENQSLERSMRILRRNIRLMTRHSFELILHEILAIHERRREGAQEVVDILLEQYRCGWGKEVNRLLSEFVYEFISLRSDFHRFKRRDSNPQEIELQKYITYLETYYSTAQG